MRNLTQRLFTPTTHLGLTFIVITAALFLVFVYVPTEREMGIIQRIFYFHVPLAWISFLAFAVIFVCSLLYLKKGARKWYRIARSSAEIGIVFTTLVLITGPIWAKAVGGVWWTWDARLTTTLLLWFIYHAYLLVGSYSADELRGARYSAVVGVIGFLDVPVVALAIVLWRSQHPGPVIFEGGLEGSMLLTLLVSLAGFTLLFSYLLVRTASLKKAEDDIRHLRNSIKKGW